MLALHAASLQLSHPIRGQPPLQLLAPLPADWQQACSPLLLAAADQAMSEFDGLRERVSPTDTASDGPGNAISFGGVAPSTS